MLIGYLPIFLKSNRKSIADTIGSDTNTAILTILHTEY